MPQFKKQKQNFVGNPDVEYYSASFRRGLEASSYKKYTWGEVMKYR